MTSTRPREITVTALLLAWTGVSLVFLSLAQPVRTWAGESWWLLLAGAGLHGITAWLAAFGLWEGRTWARLSVLVWSVAAIVAASLPFLAPHTPPISSPLVALVAVILVTLLIWLNRYLKNHLEAWRDSATYRTGRQPSN